MAILKVMDDLEAVKKDDKVSPSEQLAKKSQSLQRLVKSSKIPTPLQLLVKEMPGQTLPHFDIGMHNQIWILKVALWHVQKSIKSPGICIAITVRGKMAWAW